ncbi:TonB-dependent receptor domain-containing protein [Geminocystis sp. NIES-3709]|uniref:TonB-dependent receptor domain-containing protein n=1 Tax=Geminocystis sp. NIES-3709 TaxID=1617448 RepID=UPI0005FC89C7|nr:TonB-dependent receptor [Geminocystis sp. NIES-3709]BAQ65365.1 outer membrane vitamin B12 receptor BtuB [Geminocystis sp. NIES-3709]
MKREILFSLIYLNAILFVSLFPLSAKTETINSEVITEKKFLTQSSSIVLITGVEVRSTENGVELILKTSQGETLETRTNREMNNLIIDIPNAQLELPDNSEFRQDNLSPDIVSVSIANIEPNTVQIMVTGSKEISIEQISNTESNLVISLTPEENINDIEIIATGEPSPFVPSSAPTYTIDKSEIEQLNPRTTSELLRNLPGFAVNDYGFGADIHTGTFLRGFSINQSIFQINGRSFGSNVNTYHGATDLNSIPVDAIEQVVITSGTSATLYGSEAFGGIVNIITKKDPQPLQLGLGAEIGSYGYQSYQVGYGGTVNEVNFRVGYEYLTTNNDYLVPVGAANRDPETGKLFNGDSTLNNFYGSVEFPIDTRNYLSVDAYKTASRRGLLYFGFPLQFDRLDHDLFNIGATLTTKLGNGDDSILKTTIAYNQDYFSTYGPNAGIFYRSGVLDSQMLSGRVENQWQISPTYKLTSGFDISNNSIYGDVESNRPDLAILNEVEDRDRFLFALFALNTFQLSDNFQLELGLRQNVTSDFGSYLNPTFGTRWDITPNIAFRNSFAVLQRNPGLDQLYIFDTVHNWLPNPNLIPEKGVAYTAGFDINLSDSFLAQLTYFGSNLNDRLGVVAGRWENVGKVETNGLEVVLQWQISPEFSSFLNYTYTSAEIVSSPIPSEVGLQLSTLPYSVGTFGVGYSSNGYQANLFLNYYSGSRRALFALPGVSNTEFSPSYLSIDFNGQIPLAKNVFLTLNLENLSDRSYEKSNRIYQPGLTYRIGLQAYF